MLIPPDLHSNMLYIDFWQVKIQDIDWQNLQSALDLITNTKGNTFWFTKEKATIWCKLPSYFENVFLIGRKKLGRYIYLDKRYLEKSMKKSIWKPSHRNIIDSYKRTEE